MAQTYNKPIWVTEFACGLQPNIQSLTTIMKQFLTMLDRQPLVARQRPKALLPERSWGSNRACWLQSTYLPNARARRTALHHRHYPCKHALQQ